MHEQGRLVLRGDVVVAESALLKREQSSKYGGVPGLDDNELADSDELERQVLRKEFGPVLALSVKPSKSCIRPQIDENGDLDWGAFGTVDFDRYRGGFDKIRYKADRMTERLKNLLILFSIVNERIETRAKYLVLKYLRMGIMELEHIANDDMLALARLCVRVKRVRKEVAELREASERRRQRQAGALWASL